MPELQASLKFIYYFTHLFVHSITHPLIHLFSPPLIHSFIHSSAHPVYLSIYLLIGSFTDSFLLFIQLLIRSSIYPSVYSLGHLLIHSTFVDLSTFQPFSDTLETKAPEPGSREIQMNAQAAGLGGWTYSHSGARESWPFALLCFCFN